MAKYRDKLEIVVDMLSVIGRNGARKTRVMYQANLSYKILCRYLKDIMNADLVTLDKEDYYMLTPKGKEFLSKYEEYYDQHRHLKEELNFAQTQRAMLEKMCFNVGITCSKSLSKTLKKVRQVEKPFSVKGVILAAGEGSRMREVTYGAFPKELLPISNIPTIRFPIEAFRLASIKDILVVIAPKTKHAIIDGLQSGERFGVNISYVVQEKSDKGITGLGSAILSTQGWIGHDEDFVVACGDSILCDFSSNNPLDCLKPLVKLHRSTGASVTLLVYPIDSNPSRFGVVKFRRLNSEDGVLGGELEGLIEKPSLEIAEAYKFNGYYYIAAGYYVFKPNIFSYIGKTKPGVRNEVQITDAIALALENEEKVCAVVHARNKGNDVSPCDYWDVGIPEDYNEANKRLLKVDLEWLMSSGGYK